MSESRSLVDNLRGIQSSCRYERGGALNTFHCYDVTGDYFDWCVEQAEQLEQRYQQLEQVARDMFLCISDPETFIERSKNKYVRDGYYRWTKVFREQLEELGVEV